MKQRGDAQLLSTHTPQLFTAAVQEASLFREGEVVALPTETVYGLAANAYDPGAVRRIFEIKGRPFTNPIIAHVASLDMARQCAATWPASAQKLAAAFWPGALTLVLLRSSRIPDIVTAGGPTVGIRWPSHPFIRAVIKECGFPLAAPSANRFGELSPTQAEHVRKSLGKQISLIVDGGPSRVGIESTVLDVSANLPRILRPGMIHAESLRTVVGEIRIGDSLAHGPMRSPGLMPKHYSPRSRLVVLSWSSDQDLQTQLSPLRRKASRIHVIAHTRIPVNATGIGVSVIPQDAEAFSRALYAELHRCDGQAVDLIVVEATPPGPEWEGIADRLRRAST